MQTVPLILLAAAVALAFAATSFDYALQRIWTFQRKRLVRLFSGLRDRVLTRVGRPRRHRVDLRQVRDFVIGLQLGTSLDETLSGALARTAEQMKGQGIFGERLLRHVETRLSIAPEEVIQALAEDFGSEDLKDLALRLELAREGGITYERALSLTVSMLEEEIRSNIEQEIQQLPIRLTVPMIVGVFLPAVIIGVFPLALNVLGVLFAPGAP
jgi:hypothetical protein